MKNRFSVLNASTGEFCGINGRYLWEKEVAAETARGFYLDSSNDEFIVVQVTAVDESKP